MGSALEWYDFAVFGYLAEPLGQAFFPQVGGAWPLIASFAVFAAGYVMRPVGSLLLGPLGDRIGRRAMLSVSIVLMGGASAGIAVLPSAARWGVTATALLVALRLLQGLSLGAEYTGSITYAAEAAPPERRGLMAAVAVAGGQVGFLLGSLSVALLSAWLGEVALLGWGWRLPFAAGALVALFGLALRRAMPETLPAAAPEPTSATPQDPAPASAPGGLAGLFAPLAGQGGLLLEIGALVAFANVVFYVLFIYLVEFHSYPPLGHGPAGVGDPALVNTITTASQSLGLLAVLFGGWLCDRIGDLRAVGFGHWALLLVAPLALPLAQMGGARGLAIGQLLAVLPVFATMGGQGGMVLASVPPERRCTVFSLAYSLAMALCGGTAPLLCSWMLEQQGWLWGPAIYSSLYALPAFWAMGRFRRRAAAA
ncbi:MAG: MFS transporter [Synechococcaceae cyanobacterium]|nr:MFS transporter [Synechococcaceae cyanobacterium]